MVKAIFLDVYGTMLSFQTHRMTKTLVEALHTLRDKGIKLFVSTGRHKSMLGYVNSQFSFDGYITLSGQYCYVGNQVVHHNPLSSEAVEEIIQFTLAFPSPRAPARYRMAPASRPLRSCRAIAVFQIPSAVS